MFSSRKLFAFFVETLLHHHIPLADVEPHVIALVSAAYVLTVA